MSRAEPGERRRISRNAADEIPRIVARLVAHNESLRAALAETRLYCYRLESFFPEGIPEGWGDSDVFTLDEVRGPIDSHYRLADTV